MVQFILWKEVQRDIFGATVFLLSEIQAKKLINWWHCATESFLIEIESVCFEISEIVLGKVEVSKLQKTSVILKGEERGVTGYSLKYY